MRPADGRGGATGAPPGRRSSPGALAAALVLNLLPALPSAAQTPAKEPAGKPLFLDRLEVEIVNLDVVVTDAEGRPVDGLTREDFELKIDGEPTPIDNFYVVGPQERPGAPAGGEGAAPADEAPVAPPERREEMHVLILFDHVYSTPGERQRVAERLAATFEDGLGPLQEAAVAYYDGGIRIHQPFSSDGATVAAAIREMAEHQTNYSDDFERRRLLREISEVRVDVERLQDGSVIDEAFSALVSVRAYAEQQAVLIRRRLTALSWQVDALSGLPGRKALLYITSGLDLRPGQAVFTAWRNKFGELSGPGGIGTAGGVSNLQTTIGAVDLGDSLSELTRRANAGGVALYGIGTAATGTSQAFSAEEAGIDFEGQTYGEALDTVFRSNLGSGLELMAAVTGGEALTGGADYGRIAETLEQDAGHRYSLGFRPPDGEPGTRHRIRLEVPGREVQLRYRQEFVTSTAAEQAAGTTLSALLWDRADNDLGIAADVGPVEPSEQKDLLVLPVLVKVPFVNLVLVPEKRVHRGEITIFVVVEDDRGRLSPVQTIEAPIEIPARRIEEALAGVAGYRVGLLVRPGPHRLAIGVRDEIGDAVSALVIEHEVAAGDGAPGGAKPAGRRRSGEAER